jgi:hypothetical protein
MLHAGIRPAPASDIETVYPTPDTFQWEKVRERVVDELMPHIIGEVLPNGIASQRVPDKTAIHAC